MDPDDRERIAAMLMLLFVAMAITLLGQCAMMPAP